MNEELQEKSITKLGEIIEEPEALQEIGRKLVRQAIKNSVEEKLGLKISNPQVTQIIREGEVVPSFLLGEPDLKIEEGIAAVGWEKSWLDLWVWNRAWSELEFKPGESAPNFWDDPDVYARLRTVLTPEELEVVEKLENLG
jgi:hypothetical protein